jgi:NADH dehydrogenase
MRQTAQVAAQQGKFLGKMFGELSRRHKTLKANELPDLDDEMYNDAFNYQHLGNLAYIGNS